MNNIFSKIKLLIATLGLIILPALGQMQTPEPEQLAGASALNLTQGGTGRASYTAGDSIWASLSLQKFEVTAVGSIGNCWKVTGAVALGWGSCGSGAAFSGLLMAEGSALKTHIGSISYSPSGFNFSPTASSGLLAIDYTNGPASRSISQTITGGWTFNTTNTTFGNSIFTSGGNLGIGTTPTTRLEVQGTSSASFGLFGGLQVNGFASASYNRFGTATTGHSLNSLNDLLITGILEIDGDSFFDGTGSQSFAGSINLVKGLHTTGATGNITTSSGNLTIGGTASSSLAGSFNILKGLTANSYQGGGLTTCNSATQKVIWIQGQFGCGADVAGSAASNSLNFDEFQNPLVLDTGITFASAGNGWDFGDVGVTFGTSKFNSDANRLGVRTTTPQTVFEVQGTASASYGIFGALQVNGFASTSYNRFGVGATGHSLNSLNDLLVTGLFEVDGNTFFDGTGSQSFAGSLNASKGLTATNAAFSGTGSSSFAGSLLISKGLNAANIVGTGLTINTGNPIFAGTGSASFLGSIELSKGLHATGATSVATFAGTGSSSFAGSLKILKGFNALAIVGTGLTINTGNPVFAGTGSASFAGSIELTKGLHITGATGNITTTSGNLSIGGTASISKQFNVGGLSRLANSIAQFASSSNTFAQVNIQNFSNGASASGDLVVTNNGGTNTIKYIDLGINSTGWQDAGFSIASKSEGYLFTQTGGLAIGTASSSARAPLKFFTGGTLASNERVRITSTGLVGIGTTNPLTTLDIVGNASLSGNFELSSSSKLGINAGNKIDVPFELGGTGTVASISNKIFFDGTNGRIGIGTTAPAELLHIFGATGVFTTMRFDSGTTQGYFFAYDGDNTVNLGANSNSQLNFKVNNSTKASIDTNGNLGVNAGTVIDTKFEVGGTASMSGLAGVLGWTNAAGTPGSLCYVTATGLGSKNNALTCTVSARDQKTNIKNFLNGYDKDLKALDLINDLNPTQFAYKDKPDRIRWGFIADEVQAVDVKLGDGYDQNGNARSLDENALIALNTKAIQEQQDQIEQLKKEIKSLKTGDPVANSEQNWLYQLLHFLHLL